MSATKRLITDALIAVQGDILFQMKIGRIALSATGLTDAEHARIERQAPCLWHVDHTGEEVLQGDLSESVFEMVGEWLAAREHLDDEAIRAMLVEAALNAAALSIQNALGVTDGGMASTIIMGDTFEQPWHQYIAFEVSGLHDDSEDLDDYMASDESPKCGHSACSQSYIDGGSGECAEPTPAWFVADMDNVQSDDDLNLPYGDLHAVVEALNVYIAAGPSTFTPSGWALPASDEATARGATDLEHLLGCAAATLVACSCSTGESPAIHAAVWDIIITNSNDEA